MGLHPVCKVLASLTLFLLVVYHTNHDNGRCHAAPSPLTDPKRDGYSRLIRDIKNHPIAKDNIPPGITRTHHMSPSLPDFNEAVNASVQLMPVDILSLDPAQQVLEMSAYIRLTWSDTNLAWNASEYGGVELIELKASDVWIPKLSLLNGVQGNDLIVDSDFPVALFDDGKFSLMFSEKLKTTCALDLTMFPFDKQSCEIIVYSTASVATHVRPGHDISNFLEDFSVGGEWLLIDINAEADPGFSFRYGIKHTVVRIEVQRKTLFYLMGVVFPMGLFTAMNCLVFLIPPETGEKISFIVSMFISNTVFSSFVNGQMPRGLDDKVPLLMAYLAFMCIWSLITFLATVLVLNRFHEELADQGNRAKETKPMSRLANRSSVPAAASDDMKCVSTDGLVRSLKPGCAVIGGRTETTAPQRAVGDDYTLRAREENEPKVKAKRLDRIFLFVSLLIIVVVDAAFITLSISLS